MPHATSPLCLPPPAKSCGLRVRNGIKIEFYNLQLGQRKHNMRINVFNSQAGAAAKNKSDIFICQRLELNTVGNV